MPASKRHGDADVAPNAKRGKRNLTHSLNTEGEAHDYLHAMGEAIDSESRLSFLKILDQALPPSGVDPRTKQSLISFVSQGGAAFFVSWLEDAMVNKDASLMVATVEALKRLPWPVGVIKETRIGHVVPRCVKAVDNLHVKAEVSELMSLWKRNMITIKQGQNFVKPDSSGQVAAKRSAPKPEIPPLPVKSEALNPLSGSQRPPVPPVDSPRAGQAKAAAKAAMLSKASKSRPVSPPSLASPSTEKAKEGPKKMQWTPSQPTKAPDLSFQPPPPLQRQPTSDLPVIGPPPSGKTRTPIPLRIQVQPPPGRPNMSPPPVPTFSPPPTSSSPALPQSTPSQPSGAQEMKTFGLGGQRGLSPPRPSSSPPMFQDNFGVSVSPPPGVQGAFQPSSSSLHPVNAHRGGKAAKSALKKDEKAGKRSSRRVRFSYVEDGPEAVYAVEFFKRSTIQETRPAIEESLSQIRAGAGYWSGHSGHQAKQSSAFVEIRKKERAMGAQALKAHIQVGDDDDNVEVEVSFPSMGHPCLHVEAEKRRQLPDSLEVTDFAEAHHGISESFFEPESIPPNPVEPPAVKDRPPFTLYQRGQTNTETEEINLDIDVDDEAALLAEPSAEAEVPPEDAANLTPEQKEGLEAQTRLAKRIDEALRDFLVKAARAVGVSQFELDASKSMQLNHLRQFGTEAARREKFEESFLPLPAETQNMIMKNRELYSALMRMPPHLLTPRVLTLDVAQNASAVIVMTRNAHEREEFRRKQMIPRPKMMENRSGWGVATIVTSMRQEVTEYIQRRMISLEYPLPPSWLADEYKDVNNFGMYLSRKERYIPAHMRSKHIAAAPAKQAPPPSASKPPNSHGGSYIASHMPWLEGANGSPAHAWGGGGSRHRIHQAGPPPSVQSISPSPPEGEEEAPPPWQILAKGW